MGSIRIWLGAFLIAVGCSEPAVPGGRITVRNDILDKEFNSFVVDEVMTSGGSAGYRRTFRPGEQATIPHRHITSLRFTRRYAEYSRVYVVKCPEDFHTAIVMKLIDVHSNRLGGGCFLAKKGESRGGSITWEKD